MVLPSHHSNYWPLNYRAPTCAAFLTATSSSSPAFRRCSSVSLSHLRRRPTAALRSSQSGDLNIFRAVGTASSPRRNISQKASRATSPCLGLPPPRHFRSSGRKADLRCRDRILRAAFSPRWTGFIHTHYQRACRFRRFLGQLPDVRQESGITPTPPLVERPGLDPLAASTKELSVHDLCYFLGIFPPLFTSRIAAVTRFSAHPVLEIFASRSCPAWPCSNMSLEALSLVCQFGPFDNTLSQIPKGGPAERVLI